MFLLGIIALNPGLLAGGPSRIVHGTIAAPDKVSLNEEVELVLITNASKMANSTQVFAFSASNVAEHLRVSILLAKKTWEQAYGEGRAALADDDPDKVPEVFGRARAQILLALKEAVLFVSECTPSAAAALNSIYPKWVPASKQYVEAYLEPEVANALAEIENRYSRCCHQLNDGRNQLESFRRQALTLPL